MEPKPEQAHRLCRSSEHGPPTLKLIDTLTEHLPFDAERCVQLSE
jgi:hypothetical protein